MSPSESILRHATDARVVADAEGRRLTVRKMSALDKLRLFKAAGPTLAQNQPWLGMAMLAYSVMAIDDVPVPTPLNEVQVEAIISRLGDTGIAALADELDAECAANQAEVIETAGN